uniref:Uncharacterized protein n=1 Tax=Anguilla anguilla TaxID=7936 RepID=A0A0E9VV11_ANGAN
MHAATGDAVPKEMSFCVDFLLVFIPFSPV